MDYIKTCISFYVFRLLFICQFNNIFTFLYLQCLIYISYFIYISYNRILIFTLELFLFLSLLFKVYDKVFTSKYAQIL